MDTRRDWKPFSAKRLVFVIGVRFAQLVSDKQGVGSKYGIA